MSLPYTRRPRRSFSFWQMLLLGIGVVLIVMAWDQLGKSQNGPDSAPSTGSDVALTPTLPRSLTGRDVLPTPTPNLNAPRRAIVFPAASLTSPIIESIRTEDSWETRYLGHNVGHLEGTAWLHGPGANIVLAGHVEDENGAPGPFAYLFGAKVGDLVILQEGGQQVVYRVTAIDRAEPTEMQYVAQNGNPRLTLITCTDWSYSERTYLGRLIVVAEPIEAAEAQGLAANIAPPFATPTAAP
ncbi:MAG: sortase [Anaerolineae bacterium]|nr:sortase [Anaerolineae bacterium]